MYLFVKGHRPRRRGRGEGRKIAYFAVIKNKKPKTYKQQYLEDNKTI